jgi:hypothetical protein
MSQATKIVAKNSLAMAKLCQLLEVQKNDSQSLDKPDGHISRRIEKFKGRINRRLISLARWVDKPEYQRYGSDMPQGRPGINNKSRSGPPPSLERITGAQRRPFGPNPQQLSSKSLPSPAPKRAEMTLTPTSHSVSFPQATGNVESTKAICVDGVNTKTGSMAVCTIIPYN